MNSYRPGEADNSLGEQQPKRFLVFHLRKQSKLGLIVYNFGWLLFQRSLLNTTKSNWKSDQAFISSNLPNDNMQKKSSCLNNLPRLQPSEETDNQFDDKSVNQQNLKLPIITIIK